MPGYCVQGTIGHKILNGQRKLEMEGRATVRFLTFLLTNTILIYSRERNYSFEKLDKT